MGFHPSLRREQYRKFCCRGKSTEEKGNGTRELKDVIMRGGRGKHHGSSLKIEQQKNTGNAKLSGEEIWAGGEGQAHTLEIRLSPLLQRHFHLKMPNCSSV